MDGRSAVWAVEDVDRREMVKRFPTLAVHLTQVRWPFCLQHLSFYPSRTEAELFNTLLIITLIDISGTSFKKYHKVGGGCYHGDNKSPHPPLLNSTQSSKHF